MKGDGFIYSTQCSGSNPQAAVTARFAMTPDVRIPEGSTCSFLVGDWAYDFRCAFLGALALSLQASGKQSIVTQRVW